MDHFHKVTSNNFNFSIFTTRQRSCGMEMFSQVSVCLRAVFLVPCPFWRIGISGTMSFLGVGISGTRSLSGGGYVQCVNMFGVGVGMSRRWVRPTTPPLRTWDTTEYSRQADGTHPTGMYFCYFLNSHEQVFQFRCTSIHSCHVMLQILFSLLEYATCIKT